MHTSSRLVPYPARPESTQNSSRSSSSEDDSSTPAAAVNPVPPHDLGMMLQRCFMAVQANSRQLSNLQENVSSLTRQVGNIVTKLTESDKERFNLKDANLEVSYIVFS